MDSWEIELVHGLPPKDSGTVWYEFYPGKTSMPWNASSVYIHDEGFDLISTLFQRNLPAFAGLPPNVVFTEIEHIGRDSGLEIARDLRDLAAQAETAEAASDISFLGAIDGQLREDLSSGFEDNRRRLARMASDLAEWLDVTFKENETVTLLGI